MARDPGMIPGARSPLKVFRIHLFALATSFIALSLVVGGCTGKVGVTISGMGGNSNSGAGGDNSGAAGADDPGTLSGTGGMGNNSAGDPPKLNTTHPRLWITNSDLATLRSWAVSSNPMYANALSPLLDSKVKEYDTKWFPSGNPASSYPDTGGAELVISPTEELAALFAFAAQISPDAAKRDDYAARARKMLMYVMTEAAKGASAGAPFRDPTFAWKDRARWSGELWPLIVDWIYGYLSDADKATIRTVFLRWGKEQVTAFDTTRPVGVQNDTSLLSPKLRLRQAANNYFQAAMRNILYQGVVLDPADDANNAAHAYANEAIGGFLYQTNELFQNGDAAGGVPVEGAFFYGQEATSFTSMALLGLYTAGLGDPMTNGPQVAFATSDYWDKMVQFYPNAIAPAAVTIPSLQYLGPVYWAAEMEQTQDQIQTGVPLLALGPIALIARRAGKHELENRLLWFLRNTLPGGASGMTSRADDSTVNAILSFLVFAPDAADPADYRPALPTYHWSPTVKRLEARTSWSSDAAWFGYTCSYKSIDHQNDICGAFHYYRKGEWITKTRTGYSNTGIIDSPDYWNAIAVQNDPVNVGGYQQVPFDRGGPLRADQGDPSGVSSVALDYAYAQADSTNLYQSGSPPAHDVTLVSRSIIWLKPDVIVTYDRATTKTAGRFKRYNICLPTASPTISGTSVKATTPKGQLLRVDSLLPTGATVTNQPWESDNLLAQPEPMLARVRIEPSGTVPLDIRFLTVLQTTDGADPGAPALISVTGGAFQGAAVGAYAVLFSNGVDATSAAGVSYTMPAAVTKNFVTGLAPGATYDVSVSGRNVTISAGSSKTADQAGVLAF
jgi:hypothetical protein